MILFVTAFQTNCKAVGKSKQLCHDLAFSVFSSWVFGFQCVLWSCGCFPTCDEMHSVICWKNSGQTFAFPHGSWQQCNSPKILILPPSGSLQFLFNCRSGSICCVDFPRDCCACLLVSGQASSVSELSPSAVSAKAFLTPSGEALWPWKPWGGLFHQCEYS